MPSVAFVVNVIDVDEYVGFVHVPVPEQTASATLPMVAIRPFDVAEVCAYVSVVRCAYVWVDVERQMAVPAVDADAVCRVDAAVDGAEYVYAYVEDFDVDSDVVGHGQACA